MTQAQERPERIALAPGGHAAATWTIPREYGGMTSAMLRRSRMFALHAGVPVRILTFEPRLDVEETRRRLEDRGELAPGVTLHNVWEDLRTVADERLGERVGERLPRRVRRGDRGEALREEADETGATRRLFYRADRTLAGIDERHEGRRRVVAVTRRGYRARTWGTLWIFYRWWLRGVLPDVPTTVVVDSKALVRFFCRHPRTTIRTVHVVHGAHLTVDAEDARGPVVASREVMLRHLDDFDAVVFLTEAQRRDVAERAGGQGFTAVIPNSTAIPRGFDLAGRARGRGVVLAGLNERKRVGDAIEAIARARARAGAGAVGRAPLSLDVYGTGPERERLAAVAEGVPGVTLHGYDPHAADRLAAASFLLLTSRSEGLPLVLAESMARGCLPIAYDVRYGPADVVDHGVNGFLVPFGDVDAVAATIRHLLAMDEDDVLTMRRAAVATAGRFDDLTVLARWAGLLDEVASRRPLEAAD